jgi:hypothetical protein
MPLPKGVTVSKAIRNGVLEFEVQISEQWIDRVASAGCVPSELRSRLTEALRLQLVTRASSLGRRFVTRRQLMKELTRVRALAAKGELPDIPERLREELHDLEHRRRSDAPHGQVPPTLPMKEIDRLMRLSIEVHHYVEACCCDPAGLRKLADNILVFLDTCPDSREEWLARKSALNPEKEWAVLWSLNYWTDKLGRSPSDLKGLVPFTDVVLRMNGFKLQEPAIRQQLAGIREKFDAKP